MSNYHVIIPNDVVNGEGVCVSLFVQGCPHHCKGCFNEETWDFQEGKPIDSNAVKEILEAIHANGMQRNFSVLGGEPLALLNIKDVAEIILAVRRTYPDIKISVWTGYLFNEITNKWGKLILNNIDYLIDGPFIEEEKDLSLKWRGSKNQHIYWKNRETNKWELLE